MTTKTLADKVQKMIRSLQAALNPSIERSVSLYRCAVLKTPRLPAAFAQFMSKAKVKTTPHKANLIDFNWNQESKHAHAIGQFDLPALQSKEEENLIPEKIHRWKITEHQHIVRKIRSLENAKPSGKKYQITLLSDPQGMEASQHEREGLWQQWQEGKPERQFNIGRITNYFS